MRMSPSSAEAARHYAQFQIQTASHPKRICMLHARCVELAAMAEEEDAPAKRRMLLDKAQNILFQLQAVLQTDDTVSKSLYYLYDYCYVLLGRGETAACVQARQILTELRDTFEQLLRTL
jgi:flagellar biosynthetic protein FliS